MKKVLPLLLFIAIFVTGTGTAQASYITYTNQASWDAAVAALGLGVAVEDFADATLQTGLTTTNGSVSGGVFNGTALTQFNDAGNPRLNFAPGTRAVGGVWDLSPGGPGAGLVFVVNGSTQVGAVANTFAGFLGWVSDDATTITALRIESPGSENFSLDDVRFASGTSGPITSTPEPNSIVLLAGGLVGLVAMRKRLAKLIA